jgi:hypothetical protein
MFCAAGESWSCFFDTIGRKGTFAVESLFGAFVVLVIFRSANKQPVVIQSAHWVFYERGLYSQII